MRVEGVKAFESVSTWQQAMPAGSSAERRALLELLAAEICGIGDTRLWVAIDGYTAAGKTSLGHELAASIRRLGRSTLRASLDDFKKPWRDAIEKKYDRTSGDGYYRNAPDFESARDHLLRPAGPDGSGAVVLCAHDPLTGVNRYHAAELIYVNEVDPISLADVVIDNTVFEAPEVVSRRSPG